MMTLFRNVLVPLVWLTPSILWATCPPDELPGGSVDAFRESGFTIADEPFRQRVAVGLLGCLGNPDPALRDTLAYTTLAQWMRAGQLAPATLRQVRDRLLVDLRADDPQGLRRPFAALVLSEVARVDRVSAYLDDAERQVILDAAIDYLRGVEDYRGFSDSEGWRHGVAHGADLLLQLSLSPAFDTNSNQPVLDAIASQVSPATTSYRFGEPGRLARVVLVLASRDGLSEAQWNSWFERISDPSPLADWSAAFGSEAALARLHNLRSFLLVLHFGASQSKNANVEKLLPALNATLRQIP